ncbi:multiprotein bridging factor 1 isoform X1 [Tachypleus tridentatus]|uniref:multiprotein bridging factor 1 isoform X1 n=1 Tax=Tachypleus tridentatus TaxID=6853 RepID=UPI003FD3D204
MAESDWDTVTYLRKKAPKTSQLKSKQAINQAQRKGLAIETTKKFHAATNKQHQIDKNTAKLDRETEELHHETVGLDVGKLIQQGRQNKGLTQKELATKINEKTQVVNDYEAGRAVPNQQILAKIERVVGMKLRGKEKGKPLQPKSSN